jgi:uncharacterized protein (TIGR02271 family)
MNRNTEFDKQRELDRQKAMEQQPGENPIADQSASIPVIEEEIHVDKRIVEKGRVRIVKNVHEEEVTVDVPVVEDEMDIERVPVNKFVDTPPPAVRHEGDTMIIPVLKEVIEKRIMVVEELRITRRQTHSNAPQQVTLRKEEVHVDRIPGDSPDLNPV